MCDICKWMLLEDHRNKDDPTLRMCRCGIFRRPEGSAECYHCFNHRAELEHCPVCDAVPALKM